MTGIKTNLYKKKDSDRVPMNVLRRPQGQKQVVVG
jgi:hypothetical protein